MNPLTVLKRTLFWSYERGTWQYDVMCVLILAFIFLVPAAAFDDPEARSRRAGLDTAREQFVAAKEGDRSLETALAARAAGEEVERVEVVRDGDGKLKGYKVWTRTHRP